MRVYDMGLVAGAAPERTLGAWMWDVQQWIAD